MTSSTGSGSASLGAESRLAEPALAHELARAELIVRELDEADRAAQPQKVPDFSEVYDWLSALEQAAKCPLPLYQKLPVSMENPSQRQARMEIGA